jgi:hypothetical protein
MLFTPTRLHPAQPAGEAFQCPPDKGVIVLQWSREAALTS